MFDDVLYNLWTLVTLKLQHYSALQICIFVHLTRKCFFVKRLEIELPYYNFDIYRNEKSVPISQQQSGLRAAVTVS